MEMRQTGEIIDNCSLEHLTVSYLAKLSSHNDKVVVPSNAVAIESAFSAFRGY